MSPAPLHEPVGTSRKFAKAEAASDPPGGRSGRSRFRHRDSLKDDAGAMAEAVKEQSAQLAGQATDKVQEWIGDAVRDVPDHAASLARKAEWSTQHLPDPDVRDNILLGIAGAAVVAALSVAYQRRTADDTR